MNKKRFQQLLTLSIVSLILIIGATQRFDKIIAKSIITTSSSGITLNGGGTLNMASGGMTLTSGDLTLTSGDATVTAGDLAVTAGNLSVGNGTPGVTLDGEDAYIEGTLEVDGVATFDGTIDMNGTQQVLDAGGGTTLEASVDNFITVTLGAATGRLDLLTGNLRVGNGTPTFSQDGEDAYIEGELELASELVYGAQTTFVVEAGVPITPTGTYQPMTAPALGPTVNDVVTPTTATIGSKLILHNIDSTDVITIDGTGANVECKADVVMGTGDTLTLLWNGTDWNCLSSYDNS